MSMYGYTCPHCGERDYYHKATCTGVAKSRAETTESPNQISAMEQVARMISLAIDDSEEYWDQWEGLAWNIVTALEQRSELECDKLRKSSGATP